MARFTLRAIGIERLEMGFMVSLPEQVRANLRSATSRIAGRMESEVRSNLSGCVLKVRSGRLLGAVVTRPIDANGFIGAKVGVSNDGYVGRFYEKGFDGPMSVRSSMRRNARSGRSFGVKAYTRTIRDSHRPWLTPVLDANRATIQTELSAAVAAGLPGEM